MTGGLGVVAAVSFLWLGMVLAISFLEAPLKFRAPGIDLRLGLGIGRLVFRALNSVEGAPALHRGRSAQGGGARDRRRARARRGLSRQFKNT